MFPTPYSHDYHKSLFKLAQRNNLCYTDFTVTVSSSNSGNLHSGQIGFFLRCDVYGTEDLKECTIDYKWKKDGVKISSESQQILSFSSLEMSDSGQYTCEAKIRWKFGFLPRSTTVKSTTCNVNVGGEA